MKRLLLFVFCIYPFFIQAQVFEKLGTGLKVGGVIRTVEFDSVNNRLFVAGAFSQIENVEANNIAWRDSLGWHSFGTGCQGYISTLKYFNNKLYVGGQFQEIDGMAVSDIASWDGTSWDNLSGGVMGSVVFSIEWYDSSLYVSGYILQAGGIQVNHIVRYHNNTWESVGSGANDFYVYMKVLNDTLYAYGRFTMFNGMPADRLASFDGASWNYNSFPDSGLSIRGLDLFNGELCVLVHDPVSFENKILLKNGTTWSSYANFGNVNVNVPFFEWQGDLYVTQKISSSTNDTIWIKRIQVTGPVVNLVEFGFVTTYNYPQYINLDLAQPIGNKIFMGGTFNNCGGLYASGIAQFESGNFSSPFYCSIGYAGSGNFGFGMSMIRDSTQNRILVGGGFDFAGDSLCHSVAAWDGTNWSPLGEGLSGNTELSYVRKLIYFNGDLYAGGRFGYSGTQPMTNVAKWNGSNWSSTGLVVDDMVRDMAVYNGYLYAAGYFSTLNGSPAAGIIRFDGANWFPVPGVVADNELQSLCVFNNKLYAAGLFYSPAAATIMEFDGNNWNASSNMTDVFDLFTDNGELYFTSAVGVFRLDNSLGWVSANYSGGGNMGIYMGAFNHRLLFGDSGLNMTYMQEQPGSLYFKPLHYNIMYDLFQIDSVSAIITGFIPYVYPTNNPINGIGIIHEELPSTAITYDPDTICDHEYVFYRAPVSDFIVEHYWSFPGATLTTSNVYAPIIKYNIPGLYDFKYRVIGPFGEDSILFSNAILVDDCYLGINENNTVDPIQLFPNPATGQIQLVNISKEQFHNIRLTDITGKEQSLKLPEVIANGEGYVLDVTELSSGVYLLFIQSNTAAMSYKFIKQ